MDNKERENRNQEVIDFPPKQRGDWDRSTLHSFFLSTFFFQSPKKIIRKEKVMTARIVFTYIAFIISKTRKKNKRKKKTSLHFDKRFSASILDHVQTMNQHY